MLVLVIVAAFGGGFCDADGAAIRELLTVIRVVEPRA
jgi:hypothetical protein